MAKSDAKIGVEEPAPFDGAGGGGKASLASLASAGVCSVSDCLGLADAIAVNGAR